MSIYPKMIEKRVYGLYNDDLTQAEYDRLLSEIEILHTLRNQDDGEKEQS